MKTLRKPIKNVSYNFLKYIDIFISWQRIWFPGERQREREKERDWERDRERKRQREREREKVRERERER